MHILSDEALAQTVVPEGEGSLHGNARCGDCRCTRFWIKWRRYRGQSGVGGDFHAVCTDCGEPLWLVDLRPEGLST